MSKPKVLIGVPTYHGHSHCRERFVENLKKLSKDHDALIAWNVPGEPWGFEDFEILHYTPEPGESGIQILCNKQNYLRKKFLEGDYTHYLNLESDIIPPVDVISRLLSHKVNIANALYFLGKEQSFTMSRKVGALDMSKMGYSYPVAVPWWFVVAQRALVGPFSVTDRTSINGAGHSKWVSFEDWIDYRLEGKRLIRIFLGGLGCVLIDRKVLEAVKWRLPPENIGTSDFIFYPEANDKGYSSFLDLETICQHLHVDFDSRFSNPVNWANQQHKAFTETAQDMIYKQMGIRDDS